MARFDDLPDQPRVPHRWAETSARTVEIETPALGRCDANVRRYGAGPPLLLVHGLMTSSYSWRYVLEPLGARYTLYMPDLPGNGESARPLDRAYTPDALAEWIGVVQRELGIRGCPVIGNSMGGYLSMKLALRDPDAMSKLVNLHSPGIPEWRLDALRVAFAMPGARRALAWWVRREPMRWAHAHVHYHDESLKSLEEARAYGEPLASVDGSRAFVKHLSETMASTAVKAFARELAARRDRGEAFPVPLLLLYAEHDVMVPARFGDAMSALVPGARLERLRDASHFAHVDAVERFVPPVLAFLS